MEAWLSAYHGTLSKHIKSTRLNIRAGLIQAAVMLEFTSNPSWHYRTMQLHYGKHKCSFSPPLLYFNMYCVCYKWSMYSSYSFFFFPPPQAGHSGQLPNMDLVNILLLLFEQNGISITINPNTVDTAHDKDTYWTRASYISSSILENIAPKTQHSHASFQRSVH